MGTPLLIGIIVVAVLIGGGALLWPKIMGGSTSADALVAALSGVLKKVDSAVALSPLGRMGVCGLVIFIGKVVNLLPEANPNKAACLLACKTLGDAFVDPTVASQPASQPASNVS